MGYATTTRILSNNQGNVKCKTTSTFGYKHTITNKNRKGCSELKLLRSINYGNLNNQETIYKRRPKDKLTDLYEKFGLQFPTTSKDIIKYKSKTGTVVKSRELMYIILGGGSLYIKLPKSVEQQVDEYLSGAKNKQINVKKQVSSQRKAVSNILTGTMRVPASLVRP